MPTSELAPLPFEQMQQLAVSIARSGLFGIKTPDQALALMSIAQAEGRPAVLAARDYHIINGSPSKKSEAMLRDFLGAGGRVQWHELTDSACEATFSHPQGGEVRIKWDAARVVQAGITSPMHKKFPRQMLRSRVVSEGVRTVWPLATSGMYAPEEQIQIPRDPIDVTPPVEPVDTAADLDAFAADTADLDKYRAPEDGELFDRAHASAAEGAKAFRAFWGTLNVSQRDVLRPGVAGYQALAAAADERARDADPFGLPPLGEAHEPEPYSEGKAALTPPPPTQPLPMAPQVLRSVAARAAALTPVAGDDGEPNWPAWSEAFVALIQQATPAEARKCRLSELPHYGRCRDQDGDAARRVQEALNAKSKEAAP